MLHVFTVKGNNSLQHINTGNSNVENTSANVCIPLSGSRVDLWHANPQGVYSGIKSENTSGKNFLRGFQMTDKYGTIIFDTIYP